MSLGKRLVTTTYTSYLPMTDVLVKGGNNCWNLNVPMQLLCWPFHQIRHKRVIHLFKTSL